MRLGGGKAKGAAMERDVCKQISLWLTQGKRQDVLWRSALSGGRATIAHRKGQSVRQCGDVTAVADEGWEFCNSYYVEIKHVKKLALDQFLVKGTGPLANFWRVAQREANKHDRLPVLIAKQNGWPTIVVGHHLPWAAPIIEHHYVRIILFDDWMKNGRTPPPKRIPRE